jgi:hypothetical protein
LKYHLLFDCGLGVVDSLIDGGIDKVTHVFISHNHPDHFLEIDRLLQSHLRSSRRNGVESRVPCFCTAETRSRGPDQCFPYLNWDRLNVVSGVPVIPVAFSGHGLYSDEGLGINLRVTPIAVYHGNPKVVPSPVIWVVEFDSESGRRRVVLGWDLLHLVPRHAGEDADDLYRGPIGNSTLDPSLAILQNSDLLILEGNTWTPNPRTGHTSILTGLSITVPLLTPKGPVWFVHYSGHEDPGGAISDEDLRQRIERERPRQSAVELPAPGKQLSF